MEKISIHTESIQLDQLLKWAGIIESGGQVRPMLEEKLILVNGNIETGLRLVRVQLLEEFLLGELAPQNVSRSSH